MIESKQFMEEWLNEYDLADPLDRDIIAIIKQHFNDGTVDESAIVQGLIDLSIQMGEIDDEFTN